jgi:N-acetylglucosaminyl-diphospho-decaprenol L-rhamnosyltransferase
MMEKSGDAARATPVDVSVVIVHYETPDLLIECLESLAASEDVHLQVVVVDNASIHFDGAAVDQTFPGAQVRINESNVGFARASNRGLREATGRYMLLLNPDTSVERLSIRMMVDYMDAHPDVGCSTCRLELEDGTLDLACRRLFPTPERSLYRITMLSRLFPRSRRFGQYNLTYLDDRIETEIDSPSGAFMLVRAEVARDVGLLDEGYFMYGEDLDWAFRIKRAGWRIMYAPITTVQHRKRGSSRRFRRQTIRYFHDAMRRFYRAHYADTYPRWVTMLIMVMISARERLELTSDAVTRWARPTPR